MNASAAELSDDWGDISDAELLNMQSEYLGTALPLPLADSGSKVAKQLDSTGKRVEPKMAAVCAEEPGHSASPRKRRRPGLGRNPMERFWRTHLSVTEVCGQTWCELQVAYGYELPHVGRIKEESAEVKIGASIHLIRELEVHKVVEVQVLSREDRQAVTFLNLLSMIPPLQAGNLVRELPVFGLLEGVFLAGVIDELHYSEKGELVLNELKTRRDNALPGPAQVKGHSLQVRLYKLLFDSLVRGDLKRDHVITHLRLRPGRALGAGVLEHAGKLSIQVSTFGELLDLLLMNLSYCELPPIDRLSLEYCHQGSAMHIGIQDVPFAEPQLRVELRNYLSYWSGHREPRGVDIEEAWKCSTCSYKEHCEWKWEGSTDTVTTPTKKTLTNHTQQDTLATPTKNTLTNHTQQDTLTTPTKQDINQPLTTGHTDHRPQLDIH